MSEHRELNAPDASAPRSTRPLPGRFVACFAYALRVCVPPKRWALLGIPAVGAALFGLLARALDEPTPESAFLSVTDGLFGLVLPFATLVVGDAVLGAERRSGALALTWLSPTPFATIVGARWLAGWVVASVALLPAMAVAALVAGVPDLVGPLLVATAAASAAYVALFVVVGATFQRAALWSLGIVLLGERLLGATLSGIAQLSPQWLADNAFAGLALDWAEPRGPGELGFWISIRSGVPSGWGAVIRLAILAALFLVLAERRLRHLRLAGAAD